MACTLLHHVPPLSLARLQATQEHLGLSLSPFCSYAVNEFVERGVGKSEVAVISDEPVRLAPSVTLPIWSRLCDTSIADTQ